MAPIRKGVTEFIRASKSLLALEDLSEEEEEAVKEIVVATLDPVNFTLM